MKSQFKSIEEKLEMLIAATQAANSDKRLWSREDIANYIGLAPGTVSNSIICKVSFPRAIKLSGSNKRRWHATEVKDWVNQFREKRSA